MTDKPQKRINKEMKDCQVRAIESLHLDSIAYTEKLVSTFKKLDNPNIKAAIALMYKQGYRINKESNND